jgi:hypothetical protein
VLGRVAGNRQPRREVGPVFGYWAPRRGMIGGTDLQSGGEIWRHVDYAKALGGVVVEGRGSESFGSVQGDVLGVEAGVVGTDDQQAVVHRVEGLARF